jgi:hypothetical protein
MSVFCTTSSALAASECKHTEFAELQQMKKEDLLSERCQNRVTTDFLNKTIDLNRQQVELAASAGKIRDYEKFKSERDRNKDKLTACEDETKRIERILEKRKVKYSGKENCLI